MPHGHHVGCETLQEAQQNTNKMKQPDLANNQIRTPKNESK